MAMPRGSGKTSLCEAAAIWSAVYGHRRYLALIGAEQTSAREMLDSVKTEIESNELLLADFPGVCYPVVKLEGIINKAAGQHINGDRTDIEWSAEEVVFPTVTGSRGSSVIIKAVGIEGRIRGMKYKRPDGQSVRPDFVLIDDPQTDKSARSPLQIETRKKLIAGAILGLAGPGKKIAGVMPCTVISPGDLADQILDRKKHPEWRGERTKLLYEFPKNVSLWEEYAEIRRESLINDGD